MMRTLAAVIAAAAFAAPACCEDAPNYSHPPYQHPFEATLRAAEHGDVAAQVQVGRDYEKALGVEQDLGRAVDWYREAADAGSPQGMLALGLLLEDQSLSRAADEKPEPWLLRAAQAGLADAQVAEAKFHSTRDSPEGKKIEIEWLGHAVAQGDLKAMSLLGPMLVVSDDPNERQRGEQYIFAAEKAYPKTRLAAESGRFFREYGTSELKTAKITEQFRRAALTLDIEEARNDGQGGFGTLAVVMVIAGSFNTDDPGLRDGTFLQKRLEEAAQSGNLQSACNLAFLKLEQVPRDKEQKYYRDAFDLYLSAANRGAPRAQYHLGKLYRDGLGTDASASNAAMWFYRAAMHGYPPAEAALGDLLLHGNGVPADYAAALDWLRPAAAYGNTMAKFDLGSMYLKGLGVKEDIGRAIWLIYTASLVGWPPALDWLQQAEADPAMSSMVTDPIKQASGYIGPVRQVDSAEGGCDEPSINSKIEE